MSFSLFLIKLFKQLLKLAMMVQLVKQLDDSVRIEVIEVRIGQK